MGKQIKSLLLLRLLQQFYSYFIFHLPAIQSLYFNMTKKLRRHIWLSSTCFCHYRNILIIEIRFSCNYLLLTTDSQYLHTIQIWRNLNEYDFNQIYDLSNKSKLFSISVAEYASFSHQTRTLETDLLKCLELV